MGVSGRVGSGPEGSVYEQILSVSDAIPLNRLWLLLDRRNQQVHLLSRSGTLERSVGGPGAGPGELSRPVALVGLAAGFAVVDVVGSRIDLFDHDGSFIRRVLPRSEGCPGGLVHGAASADGESVLVLRHCLSFTGTAAHARLDRIEPSGRSESLLSVPLTGAHDGSLDPLSLPLLSARRGEILVGLTTDPCLRRIRDGLVEQERVCYSASPLLPLPRDLREEVAELISRKSGALIPGYRTPRHYPYFDEVFSTERGVIVRVFSGREDRVLCLLDTSNGECTMALEANEGSFPGDASVLMAIPEIDGTRIRLIPYPSPDEDSGAGPPTWRPPMPDSAPTRRPSP
jgi:hypothetical protein